MAKEGVSGLYRGFSMSVFCMFLYRAAYFGLYDTAKPFMSGNILMKMFLAQVVSNTSQIIAYPFDTARRRLMMQSGKSKDKVQYKGSIDCLTKMYKQEGYRGFYKGAVSNVFRGVGSSLVLVLYDELREIFVTDESK